MAGGCEAGDAALGMCPASEPSPLVPAHLGSCGLGNSPSPRLPLCYFFLGTSQPRTAIFESENLKQTSPPINYRCQVFCPSNGKLMPAGALAIWNCPNIEALSGSLSLQMHTNSPLPDAVTTKTAPTTFPEPSGEMRSSGSM